MIGFFPPSYPDELFYSRLARFYQRSGYMIYRDAATELFTSPLAYPDPEYLGYISNDLKNILANEGGLVPILLKQTMFPHYARFISLKKRQMTLEGMITGNLRARIGLQEEIKNKSNCFLRYCPCCAKEDLSSFGETYWHRIHQLKEISVCPKHGCYLLDGNVRLLRSGSPNLIPCQPEEYDIRYGSAWEKAFAVYCSDIFTSELSMDLDYNPILFIRSYLKENGFSSLRKGQVYLDKLLTELKRMDPFFRVERDRVKNILEGKMISPEIFCRIGMLLDIPPDAFVKMEALTLSHSDDLDDKILSLKQSGLRYKEIATKLNISLSTVKDVGSGRLRKESSSA